MTRCDVSGYTYIDSAVRRCPHPKVIARYGHAGKCNVSWLICRKCQFGRKGKYDGGWMCDYGKQTESDREVPVSCRT